MRLDILIAIGAAICQAVPSLLGFRATVVPIRPEQGKRKAAYEVLFVVSTVVGIVLVSVMASRAPLQPAHFTFSKFPTYGGEDASWASGPPDNRAAFLQIGSPLSMNVWTPNVGPGVASNSITRAAMFTEPNISSVSENEALDQFGRISKSLEPLGPVTLASGQRTFITAEGPIVTPEDYSNLVSGRRVAYLIVEIAYRDDTGSHTRHLCQAIEPPQQGGRIIYSYCKSYNDEL
jgi:hypothetical protein